MQDMVGVEDDTELIIWKQLQQG